MRKTYRSPELVRIPDSPIRTKRRPSCRSYKRYPYGGLRKFILLHLPDFCWQTPAEIVEMLEIVDEDIDVATVIVTLFHLKRDGLVEKRRYTKFRPNGYQMKKVVAIS